MAEIVWTENALNGLKDMAAYIQLESPLAASRLVEKVLLAVKPLEKFPRLGRVPPELSGSIFRELIVSPCRILYREQMNQIQIVCLFREERQLRNFMLSEEFKEYAS